jgi:hypothetical protein
MNSQPGSEISNKGEKMSQVVLITGCSTGIGRDLADQLSKAGCIVVATARKVGIIADLPIVLKLPLDRQYQPVSDSMRKQEPGSEVVTKAIRKALGTIKPKARYLAGISLPIMLVLYMRDLVWDLAVRQLFTISPQE